MSDFTPFNKPYLTGDEFTKITKALAAGQLSGDGSFSRECHKWLEVHTGALKALLTLSCTAALEMQSLLLDLEPGDEVIMPSFTFVSTANAVCLRGAVPVFVDIRPDTLNIDEKLIEDAVTPRTRAIAPVHYAGVGCEMDTILNIARRHRLAVIEDAAQGMMASYKGRSLGTIGDLGAVSFHATKNIISGEGGALLINNPAYIQRAEILREKGTDRSRFYRGEVDKYTWQDVGSSFLPSELTAAFLAAQFEHAECITAERMKIWERYHALLEPLERAGILRRPIVPSECKHNAHIYYVILNSESQRHNVLSGLRESGIQSVFHYVPLHSAPAGKRFGRVHGSMALTDDLSGRMTRLPMWIGLTESQQEYIVERLAALIG